jgi:hypothetical protein
MKTACKAKSNQPKALPWAGIPLALQAVFAQNPSVQNKIDLIDLKDLDRFERFLAKGDYFSIR